MRIRRNALTDRYVVPILAFGDQVVWDSVVTLAIRNAETAKFASCNNKCVKGRSCSGQSCKKNSDCGSGEKCCIETGKCVGPDECEDVSKISCRKDIDCYSATKKYYCCGQRCRDDSFCENKLFTIFTPVAVCIFIVVTVFFIFRYRKKRIHRPGQTQVLRGSQWG